MQTAESVLFRFLLGIFLGSIIGTLLPLFRSLQTATLQECPPIFDPEKPINLDPHNDPGEAGITFERTERKRHRPLPKLEPYKPPPHVLEDTASWHATVSNHAEKKSMKRGFAYVGVMCTDTLIRTRGLSAAETWAQDLSRIKDPTTGQRTSTAKLELYGKFVVG